MLQRTVADALLSLLEQQRAFGIAPGAKARFMGLFLAQPELQVFGRVLGAGACGEGRI